MICWQAYTVVELGSGQRIIRSCRQRKLPQKISRGYETTEKIFNERSLHNDASSFASGVSRAQQAGETEQGFGACNQLSQENVSITHTQHVIMDDQTLKGFHKIRQRIPLAGSRRITTKKLELQKIEQNYKNQN